MKPMIYLDHAATTGVRPEVLEEMLPYLQEEYCNPSSVYDLAGRSRKAVEEARQRLSLIHILQRLLFCGNYPASQ